MAARRQRGEEVEWRRRDAIDERRFHPADRLELWPLETVGGLGEVRINAIGWKSASTEAIVGAVSPKSSRSPERTWTQRLAERVRERRKVLRLTQVDVATLSGCGPDFLYDLERAKPTLRLDKLLAVLDVLGLELQVTARGQTNEDE